MATLNISLINTTTSSNVYAYVTGLEIDRNNARILIQSDGRTVYRPASPSSTVTPLAQDCAIPLGAPGSSKAVTIPHIAGGRIYFSVNSRLSFFVNPGPALVEPSATNPTDPNINILWGFCEFTWNAAQLYANISYVDFVALPISVGVTGSGGTRTVQGMRSNGLQTVANGLTAQTAADGKSWSSLIQRNSSGTILRCLSPNHGMVINGNLFSGYYDPYVTQVWSRYASQTMTIDMQGAGGVASVSGRVQNGNLVLNNVSFARPSTRDIFSANSGPFVTGSDGLRNAIIPRLNAEFNRSTLLKTNLFPAPTSLYYQETITNHYARIVHAANIDGRGYAHPYDDVAPLSGGDQSGYVNDGAPSLFTVTVGGGQFTSASAKVNTAQANVQQPLQQDRSEGETATEPANGQPNGSGGKQQRDLTNGTADGRQGNKKMVMSLLKKLRAKLKSF